MSLHPNERCCLFVLVITETAQMIPIAVDHLEVRLRVGTCEHPEHDTLHGCIELRYIRHGGTLPGGYLEITRCYGARWWIVVRPALVQWRTGSVPSDQSPLGVTNTPAVLGMPSIT